MADMRTLYYNPTTEPVQHFDEYSIRLMIEKEENVMEGEKDFGNDPSNRGKKGFVERNFRILKMSKDILEPECEVVTHCQFRLLISNPEPRRTFKMEISNPELETKRSINNLVGLESGIQRSHTLPQVIGSSNKYNEEEP